MRKVSWTRSKQMTPAVAYTRPANWTRRPERRRKSRGFFTGSLGLVSQFPLFFRTGSNSFPARHWRLWAAPLSVLFQSSRMISEANPCIFDQIAPGQKTYKAQSWRGTIISHFSPSRCGGERVLATHPEAQQEAAQRQLLRQPPGAIHAQSTCR